MGHLVQMAGLAVQNFVSAAVGHGRRGRADPRLHALAHRPDRQLLGRPGPRLPAHPAAARRASARSLLVALGAVQNFSSGTDVTTLAGQSQTITGGPVASQEAIKELGTNGGGFYNANSAHPFENPNAFSNLLEIFLLLLIPVAPDPHVRADGQGQAAGLRDPGRDGRPVGADPGRRHGRRGTRTPARRCSWPARRWRARRPGSGSARLGAVRHLDDRHVHRRGQLLPRLVHRARRRPADLQHGARRGRARRRRHPASTGCWCWRSSRCSSPG